MIMNFHIYLSPHLIIIENLLHLLLSVSLAPTPPSHLSSLLSLSLNYQFKPTSLYYIFINRSLKIINILAILNIIIKPNRITKLLNTF